MATSHCQRFLNIISHCLSNPGDRVYVMKTTERYRTGTCEALGDDAVTFISQLTFRCYYRMSIAET